MKLNKVIMSGVAAGVLSFLPAGNVKADTPAQTSTSDWTVSRTSSLVSTSTSGAETSEVFGSVTVSKYTGALNLGRVVIKIAQPITGDSPTISASLSLASGSTTFDTSTSQNRVTEQTAFLGSSISVYDAVVAAGGDITDYSFTKASPNYANVTVNAGTPLTRSVNTTESAFTLFDSTVYSMTEADLTSIFRDGSNISFGYDIASKFLFSRDNATTLTASLSGSNTGQITVEYYAAVPEPTTVGLLLGAGGLGIVAAIRRRRAKA